LNFGGQYGELLDEREHFGNFLLDNRFLLDHLGDFLAAMDQIFDFLDNGRQALLDSSDSRIKSSRVRHGDSP
jgi:hypothetical protein